MQDTAFLNHLAKHIPVGAPEMIWPLIEDFNFNLKVTNDRVTKHGDYRRPIRKSDPHKISVNATLNPQAFLLTLIHEIAHMHAYEFFGNRIKPHGKEWKQVFATIADPFLAKHIWLPDVEHALKKYFRNPKASSGADSNLVRVLSNYDENQDLTLEDISEGDLFLLASRNRRWFKKGPKRRTRFLCTEIETGRDFTIHGLAKIIAANEQ